MSRTSTGELTSRMGVVGGTVAPSPKGGGPPRLVVLMGQEPGRRFSLDGGHALVGRSEECDIQLDDTKVSRQHARVAQREDGAWYVEDLGSRNGTLVNGERVDLSLLKIGDRIQLSGETLLLFTRQDPLEDLLLHRQQMEVIGQLAAGIAHDFNNLLNVISTSTAHLDTLDPSTPLSDADVRECRQDISEAASRAAELTARLLTIARRREQQKENRYRPVDVSALCGDVLQLVRRTFDRSVQVTADIQPGLAVEGDQAALHQLVMNLCINARDAMPDGGTLEVVARLDADPQPTATSPWSPGPQVVLEVRDTGVGMDEKTRARVFEPFFTTKESGAGSGLGLATVYEVATSHGGGVEVDSAIGVGSCFRVRLPSRVARAADQQRTKRKRKSTTWDGQGAGRKHGRVLVVDDQELVRRSLGRLVKASGHEVLYAADGREALEVYAASEPRPDVVLLDLDMPHLSGAEALEQLKVMDPGARVVLISGYYDDTRKQRMLSLGATDFLGKPVDAKKLRDAIRIAMTAPAIDF
ncbi:MAG: response regulator [Myxococcota bacterium]|nr:response regulator [Myxococcota bacterium]